MDLVTLPDVDVIEPRRIARSISSPDSAGFSSASPRALVLLCGSPRRSELYATPQLAPLALPVDEERQVMDMWRKHALDLSYARNLEPLTLQVLMDRNLPALELGAPQGRVRISVSRDRDEYRGTGGVLRDFVESSGFEDDNMLLVASGAQLVLEPLPHLLAELEVPEADVAVMSHPDGTPSGLMLMRCECLRMLPAVGFCDLKEQGLRLIRSHYRVVAVERAPAPYAPVRTVAGYIEALRRHYLYVMGATEDDNPFAEDWEPTFSLVEEGAQVHESACVHDSVVMSGGRVEAGALVVRSVVAAGGVVRRGRTVMDQLISAGN